MLRALPHRSEDSSAGTNRAPRPLRPRDLLAALIHAPVARCRGPAPTRPRTHPVQSGREKLPVLAGSSKRIGARMWPWHGRGMTDNCLERDQFRVGRFSTKTNRTRLNSLQDDRFRNTEQLRKQCVRASARTALGAGRCAEPIIPASTDRTRSRHKPTGTRRFAPSGMHHRLASGLSGHRVCPPTSRASSREKAPMKTPDARANASRPGTGLRPSVLRSRFPAPTPCLGLVTRFRGNDPTGRRAGQERMGKEKSSGAPSRIRTYDLRLRSGSNGLS